MTLQKRLRQLAMTILRHTQKKVFFFFLFTLSVNSSTMLKIIFFMIRLEATLLKQETSNPFSYPQRVVKGLGGPLTEVELVGKFWLPWVSF